MSIPHVHPQARRASHDDVFTSRALSVDPTIRPQAPWVIEGISDHLRQPMPAVVSEELPIQSPVRHSEESRVGCGVVKGLRLGRQV